MTLDREREFRTVLPLRQRFFVVKSLVDQCSMTDSFFQVFQVFEPLNRNVSRIPWNAPDAQPSLDNFQLAEQPMRVGSVIPQSLCNVPRVNS